jgi:hypothetical protein
MLPVWGSREGVPGVFLENAQNERLTSKRAKERMLIRRE